MNPIKAWRESRRLSREKLALLLGINYWTLFRIERGVSCSVSLRLAERLKELGYPGDPRADYQAWREEMIKGLREKILVPEKEKGR